MAVLEHVRQNRADAEVHYWGLAHQVAAGESPEPEAVENVLAATKKTLEEFEGDVRVVAYRMTLRRQFDAREAAPGLQAKLEAELAREQQKLIDAQKTFRQRAYEINSQLSQIKDA